MTEDGRSELAAATRREISLGNGRTSRFHSLPALEELVSKPVSRLPVALRIVLESVLRNADGRRIRDDHVRDLAGWRANAPRNEEIPFTVGRVVLNCAAGIPLLGDLTAIRAAMSRGGLDGEVVRPAVPVDMALDHTLTVDFHGTADAMAKNMALDIHRNEERYRFVKWALHAYEGIRLFPPGTGILHQLNLEYLAPGLLEKDGVSFPDTLVGTDSHTGMIAGMGTVGWGVGGIEAQAAVLGQPVFLLMPDVVGVQLTGRSGDGVTATDLVLHLTRMLRDAKVVGQFVEFFGPSVAALTIPDRATIANMAPEYGATIGYFPVDEQTCRYLGQTGRSAECVQAVEAYYREQGLFGAPRPGTVDYSRELELDLGAVEPSLAGPKRPQDLVPLSGLKKRFAEVLSEPQASGGYGKPISSDDGGSDGALLKDGAVVIAAIASCTNTSNPGVILGAGLLARNAVERGLQVKPWVKTSMTPGSIVVSKYLEAAGLQAALDQLGFTVAGYSCATCVGASGPIDAELEAEIDANDIVACAVLSGNRNFEARIHASVRASFLASPALVVAFAIAGRVDIDMAVEPLGDDRDGEPVYLRDIWPSAGELEAASATAANPDFYHQVYDCDITEANPLFAEIDHATGRLYPWDPASTYLREPPFLAPAFRQSVLAEVRGARALAILGDSVTTDHISPIGTIESSSPAGIYLERHGVEPLEFNNYGSRRMNREVMIRGTFANLRLKNAMLPGIEGGVTLHQPDGEQMTIYDAAMRYREAAVPLIVIAGQEYGTGSARDWAAKGTRLLGVRAVVAGGFERIHRSNLVGMGVMPCELPQGTSARTLLLDGSETYDILGLEGEVAPRQGLTLRITRADGSASEVALVLRVDTQAELDYMLSGGMMPYLLSRLASGCAA